MPLHYFVLNYDADNISTFYQDGLLTKDQTTDIYEININTNDFYIGDYADNGIFDGVIDEVRISNICRDEDWIITSYNNQSDPGTFFSIGLEQDAPIAWAPDTDYEVNDLVTYGGNTYYCIQAHHSLTGWEPPLTPALWGLL